MKRTKHKHGEEGLRDFERKQNINRAKEFLKKHKAERAKNNPIFSKTDNLLLKAGDNMQYIIQGDHTPTTANDFLCLDSIRYHMYRFVRLAGQMGINLMAVWEKTAARHGLKMELPEHLRKLNKGINTDSFEDAEIIDD